MKVKELIKRLKSCDQNKDLRFYYLKNNTLNGCQYETIIEIDEQVELTIQDDTESENITLCDEQKLYDNNYITQGQLNKLTKGDQ